MSRNKVVTDEKDRVHNLFAKKAQRDEMPDTSSTIPVEGEPVTPGAIQTHPLEPALKHIDNIQENMGRVVLYARELIRAMKELKETGNTHVLMDVQHEYEEDFWKKAEKESRNIMNHTLTFLPLRPGGVQTDHVKPN